MIFYMMLKKETFFVFKDRVTKFEPILGGHQEIGNTKFQQNPSCFVDTGPKNDFAGLLNRTIETLDREQLIACCTLSKFFHHKIPDGWFIFNSMFISDTVYSIGTCIQVHI